MTSQKRVVIHCRHQMASMGAFIPVELVAAAAAADRQTLMVDCCWSSKCHLASEHRRSELIKEAISFFFNQSANISFAEHTLTHSSSQLAESCRLHTVWESILLPLVCIYIFSNFPAFQSLGFTLAISAQTILGISGKSFARTTLLLFAKNSSAAGMGDHCCRWLLLITFHSLTYFFLLIRLLDHLRQQAKAIFSQLIVASADFVQSTAAIELKNFALLQLSTRVLVYRLYKPCDTLSVSLCLVNLIEWLPLISTNVSEVMHIALRRHLSEAKLPFQLKQITLYHHHHHHTISRRWSSNNQRRRMTNLQYWSTCDTANLNNDELNLCFATLPPVTFLPLSIYVCDAILQELILQAWLGNYPSAYSAERRFLLLFSFSVNHLPTFILNLVTIVLSIATPKHHLFLFSVFFLLTHVFIIYWMKTTYIWMQYLEHSAHA